MLEDPPSPDWADVGQTVEERRRRELPPASLPVKGYRKSVSLVADPLQEQRPGIVARQGERLARPGTKTSSRCFASAATGTAAAPAGQAGERRRELTLAAVDQHQVGPRRETLVVRTLPRLDGAPGRAARERRATTSRIIAKSSWPATSRPANLRYCDFFGGTVLEHDHRRDRVRVAQVGDVEAFDAQRQMVEAERVAQAREGRFAGLAPLRDALGLYALRLLQRCVAPSRADAVSGPAGRVSRPPCCRASR